MFYGHEVQETRQLFFSSWDKQRKKEPLLPLEQQIVDVILLHPEYHSLLESSLHGPRIDALQDDNVHNPFLHLGLHLSIRDQIKMDRPTGFRALYQQLVIQEKDQHRVEHWLMEILYDCLSQAQRLQTMPNETHYLEACRQLLARVTIDG